MKFCAFQFMHISSFSLCTTEKTLAPSCLHPYEMIIYIDKILPSLPFSKLNSISSLSLSLYNRHFKTLITSVAFC